MLYEQMNFVDVDNGGFFDLKRMGIVQTDS